MTDILLRKAQAVRAGFSMGAKWLELLKQLAPGLTRVAVLRDASQGFAVSQFVAIQAVGPSLGVEVIPVNMRSDHHAGGRAKAAGGLLGTLVRRCRRPDLLWA